MDIPDARAVLGEYTETIWRCSWEGKAVGNNRRFIVRRGVKRLIPNPDYVSFKDELTYTFIACKPKLPFRGQIGIALRLRIDPRRDWDSLIKPVCDCLQAAGVIENDRQIRGHIGVYVEDKKPGEPDRVEVEIG